MYFTLFELSASANIWLLPILPSCTKTSLDTQNGCDKCLGYQPLEGYGHGKIGVKEKPQWIM